MTNYLASGLVQQVTITIANGATTGTATINAVGSGAFIVYQGENPTDTANVNDSMCRVEITNSTTITATRGATGSSQSVTVNAVIIDGDTTNLIKTVQYGTIAMTTAQTSNTATLGTAVTDGNTANLYLGASVVTSSTSWSNNQCVITRSGTTVTATKQFSGTAVTAGYCIVEFQSGALAQTTQVVDNSATPSNQASRTSTITSADTNNTILFYGGMYGNGSASSNTTRQTGEQTNATTLTFKTNGNSSVALRFVCTAVTFASGVLAQNVQRGRINLAAATSNTATITSASTTNGFINYVGNTASPTAMSPATQLGKITQTNATTVTATFNTSSTGDFSWESAVFSVSASGVFTKSISLNQSINRASTY